MFKQNFEFNVLVIEENMSKDLEFRKLFTVNIGT